MRLRRYIYVRARFDGIPQSYIGAYAGVFLYKEPVDKVLIMAFGLIWIGLIFFSYVVNLKAVRIVSSEE